MIFQKIQVSGLGPFATPATLELEADLTVLTGRNDVGKSFILRLMQLLCTRQPISEEDANLLQMQAGTHVWSDNPELQCDVELVLMQHTADYMNNGQAGDKLAVEFHLAPNINNRRIKAYTRGGTQRRVNANLAKLPEVIFFPSDEEIRSIINLSSPSSIEQGFLLQAFGHDASNKILEANRLNRYQILRQGGNKITDQFAEILPPGMQMAIEFVPDGSDLLVFLEDAHAGRTPLTYRGTGVQKIINILYRLLNLGSNTHTLLLFDEPENGLHADAQHELRRFLEKLATSDHIQVLYATHSPAMINPMRPQTVRLLEQTSQNDEEHIRFATTVIDNRPLKGNLYNIRRSLGIWPSDSLLYAPITVIVEGLTERLSLPYLLQRLNEAGLSGFEEFSSVGGLVSFCDGDGNSYSYLTDLAMSQNCIPIIFLDGDKNNPNRVNKVQKKHPEVPIIYLNQTEFEEIVPRETYFSALQQVTGVTELTVEAFEKWIADTNPQQQAFTKQVDKWLCGAFPEVLYQKAEVMNKAIEIVDLDQVDTVKLQELVKEIFAALEKL